MNIPTHVALGALLCNVVVTLDKKYGVGRITFSRKIVVGTLCVILSIAVPHYDVVYKIITFPTVPALPRLLLVSLKVMLFCVPILYLAWPLIKAEPWIVGAALFGAVYPDVEKGLYLNMLIPRWLVLFGHHSSAYSSDGGDEHKALVLVIEGCVLLLSMVGVYWLVRCRQQSEEHGSEKPIHGCGCS